ncbi:hypothetical protein CC78DRAFT_580174 [Lojkania enalia]|uniref:Amino acid permease/ SLC12A domain-containing protein n=1 Tax=Lojkania enalia TaxID=147567 RepID=A0A9P4N8G4_9PLEO|nr:hypothetical protein CC78DRAFT_580174 [Didymosphaeria enalia]
MYIFISLSIAAFAYVGVEITTAAALEARVPTERTPSQCSAIGNTVKFSAVFTSFDDPNLPRISWQETTEDNESKNRSTALVFIIIAEYSGIPRLADTLNALLMFTVLICANTNLYVASRTLFSLIRNIDGGPGQPWYTRFFAILGRTKARGGLYECDSDFLNLRVSAFPVSLKHKGAFD